MSKRWMREVLLAGATNRGVPVLIKMWNLFLQKVCGYTYVSQDGNAGDFNTYEKNGTNGSFGGADFNFTDSVAGAFVAGDVNKWLLVVDSTNAVNCGWYKIIAYVNANTVTIAFRSGATEYPTAASSLSWYVLGETYDMPATLNDYVRIQTPHVDGWQIEFRYVVGGANSKINLYLSVNGVWGAGQKVLSAPLFNLDTRGTGDMYNYMIAETNGTFFLCWQIYTPTGYNDACGVSKIITEFESGHPAIEKWCLMGSEYAGSTEYRCSRWPDDLGWIRMWRESLQSQKRCRWLEITDNANDSSFCYNTTANEKNVRTTLYYGTDKNDIMLGCYVMVDEDNAQDLYEMPGLLTGIYMVRSNLTAKTAVSHDGTRDLYHINDGLMVDWPGVTPQF